jgi:hypothetical protein
MPSDLSTASPLASLASSASALLLPVTISSFHCSELQHPRPSERFVNLNKMDNIMVHRRTVKLLVLTTVFGAGRKHRTFGMMSGKPHHPMFGVGLSHHPWLVPFGPSAIHGILVHKDNYYGRELAYQIRNEYNRFAKFLPDVKVGVFYSGSLATKKHTLTSSWAPRVALTPLSEIGTCDSPICSISSSMNAI